MMIRPPTSRTAPTPTTSIVPIFLSLGFELLVLMMFNCASAAEAGRVPREVLRNPHKAKGNGRRTVL
jgi:hypothetical protein